MAKKNIDTASVGIPKLDKLLIDGIPVGSTMLVKGPSGSGTELFAKQFASVANGAKKKVYTATDERESDVRRTMAMYKWPTKDLEINDISTTYFEKVLTKDMEASKLRREGIKTDTIRNMIKTPRTERDVVNFLTELVYNITHIETPYRLVVDSLDFYLHHYDYDNVLSSFRTIKVHTQYTGSLALFTMSTGVFEGRAENAIEGIADIIIEMEIQRVGSEFETRLVIKKFRNYPNKCAILTFSVSEEGITPEMVARVA